MVMLNCECGQEINMVAEKGFRIEGAESRTIRCPCGKNAFSAEENIDNADEWWFVECGDIDGGVTEEIVLACVYCNRKITLVASRFYGAEEFQVDYLRGYGERFKWFPVGDKLEKVPYFGEP
jgi:hypothetical protein